MSLDIYTRWRNKYEIWNKFKRIKKKVITGIEKAVTKKATLEIFETVQFRREEKGNIVFEAQNMNGDGFGILRLLKVLKESILKDYNLKYSEYKHTRWDNR